MVGRKGRASGARGGALRARSGGSKVSGDYRGPGVRRVGVVGCGWGTWQRRVADRRPPRSSGPGSVASRPSRWAVEPDTIPYPYVISVQNSAAVAASIKAVTAARLLQGTTVTAAGWISCRLRSGDPCRLSGWLTGGLPVRGSMAHSLCRSDFTGLERDRRGSFTG